MMNKTLLVLFFSSASNCSMEVTVFDVGQGNSVLLHCTDMEKKEPPLLSDCGSSAYEYRSTEHKVEQIEVIVGKIKDYVKCLGLNRFNILISHPDTDHYNWIIEVIKGCESIDIEVGRITLGGLKKYYKSTFNTFLDSLRAEKDFLTDEKGDSSEIKQISTSANPAYDILPALKQTSEKKSNDCSLVLLVTFGNLRCIVMADATKDTIKHIEETYKIPETYLYIASHHGAIKEGCNEESLLEKLKPKMIVVSSGIHGHKHPRAEVISRFESKLDEDLPDYHPLIMGSGEKDKQSGLTYHSFMRRSGDVKGRGAGYGLSATNKALFGTLMQGTMTFSWDESAMTMKSPEHSMTEYFGSKKDCVLKCLIKPPVETLSLGFLELINLCDLGIDDEEPTDESSLHEILEFLLESEVSLKEFLLSRNKIKVKKITDLIEKLLEKKQIREFQMTDVNMAKELKQDITKIWNNRGLLL